MLVIEIIIAVALVGILLALVALNFQLPLRRRRRGQRPTSAVTPQPPGAGVPAGQIVRTADHISRVRERLTESSNELVVAKQKLTAAESEAASAPNDVQRQNKVDLAKGELAKVTAEIDFENSILQHLIAPAASPTLIDHLFGYPHWATAVQYGVFASLAAFVLYFLVGGITPPTGTTPRSMITFLIAMVTVGIALILVLATIVSNSDDRKERFSQGKEILTALLGVLGTIVGFYFGTDQESRDELIFDPVVITRGADSLALRTEVHGGKLPYAYDVTFSPSTTAPVSGQTNGEIHSSAEPTTGVPTTFLIKVRDAEGNTGILKGEVPAREASPSGGASAEPPSAKKSVAESAKNKKLNAQPEE